MTDHRIAALKALGYIPQAQDEARHTALASEATAHALLAIEARLGELAEEQRAATLLAGSAYGMTDPGFVRRLVERKHGQMADAAIDEPTITINVAEGMTPEQVEAVIEAVRERLNASMVRGR
ncbi:MULTISPECIES: hypothetical protein [Nocardia]|uniref:hypothetical protein n=1 Tax=Nocardia TaxID=1817 RepID=UPI0007A3EE34|nr:MULTISPECIES: hypothetical protein [Nocardia]